MTRLPAACRTHRPVLVDLVDRGERGTGTPAALDHLDTCGACEREITEIALTIIALRRAGAAYRALAVPGTSCLPVVTTAHAAAHRPRRPWAWRLQLGGLVTSAAIAALLVSPRVGLDEQRPTAAVAPQGPASVISWQSAERRLASSPDVAPIAMLRSLPPRYPEGFTRHWKEVPPTDAAARELEPS